MPTRGGARRSANGIDVHARTTTSRIVPAVAVAPSVRKCTTPTPTYLYYLVQRLSSSSRTGRKGFDSKFELEYMGSSEYEFGAAGASLARMRSAGSLEVREVNLTLQGHTKPVFIVASASDRESFDTKIRDLQTWLDKGHYSKEATYFDILLTGNFRYFSRKYIYTTAWWSLRDDVMWTFDRKVVDDLIYGLENPPT